MSARFEITYPPISDLQFINSEIRRRFIPAHEAYHACLSKFKSRELQEKEVEEVEIRVKIVHDYIRSNCSGYLFAECFYTDPKDEQVWENELHKPVLFAKKAREYSLRAEAMIRLLHAKLEKPPVPDVAPPSYDEYFSDEKEEGYEEGHWSEPREAREDEQPLKLIRTGVTALRRD